MKLTIYADGGARGNPGPAGMGVVIQDGAGKTVKELSERIGVATNNQAEYRALIRALEEAKKLKASAVAVILDSELVVKQLQQKYKVRDKDLQPLFVQAWNLLQGFSRHGIKHVRRGKNKRADKLVNQALNQDSNGR